MTIEWCRGDMFASGAEALVCAANAQGRLGAGQALEVRRRFPDHAAAFCRNARSGAVLPGQVYPVGGLGSLILFATVKADLRAPSRLQWIAGCAVGLRRWGEAILAPVKDRWGENHEPPSVTVALPALGCGLGGLPWTDVRPILERELAAAPGVRWLVYEPGHVVRMQIAEAIAKRISWPNRIRANAWTSGPPRHRVRVFLASELEGRNGGKRHTGVRLGWLEVDEQLRISAHGAHAWLEDAEAAKAEVLADGRQR